MQATDGLDVIGRIPVPEDSEVTDPATIFLLLKRALAQHAILAVRVGQDDESYMSAMLEVVSDGCYIVLDEFIPSRGHKRLAHSREIKVRTLVDGIRLSFDGVVSQLGEESGSPYYKVPFPERVHYAQRRLQFRVNVPLKQHIPLTIYAENDHHISGELRDISAGGVSAMILEGDIEPFRSDNQVYQCTLYLPEDRTIFASIRIRHISDAHRNPDKRALIGALFLEMMPRKQREIERFVAALDREQTRKR